MLVSRRQFVQGGIVVGAGTVLGASPALAAAADAAGVAPYRAEARVMVDPAVDSQLLARARASFLRHRAAIRETDVVAIADFSKPSALPRFYLMDTQNGRVTTHLVSHGRGSDPEHSGMLRRFSNGIGSNATSNGAYITGDYYHGRYGRSMRVAGLDHTNFNAEARAIVVHSAWYAEPSQIAQHGRLGRSEGCFALSYSSLQEALARLGPGRFLYADRIA